MSSILLDKYTSIDVKKSKILKFCRFVKRYQDIHNPKKLYLILKVLSQSGLDISLRTIKLEISEWLIEHNVFEIASELICFIESNNQNYLNDPIQFPIMDQCLEILINYLETNDRVCEIVSKLPVLNFIYNSIINSEYHERLRVLFSTNFQKLYSLNLIDRKDIYHLGNYRIYMLITSSWCIIHNLAAYSNFKAPFANQTVYNSMINVMKSSRHHTLLIMTYSTLALIIDDDNVNLLNVGEFSLNYFINVAYHELTKSPSIVTSFHLWEILNVLYSSIRNNDIANSFVLKGGIKMIIDVLEKTYNPNDEKYASLILQKVILNSETKTLVYSLPDFNFLGSLKNAIKEKPALMERLVDLGLKELLYTL